MNINMTMLGQAIAFAFFVWFCMRYVWPPVITALRARQADIAAGLDAAERGQHSLEAAEQKVQELNQEAKRQAAAILEQANRRAGQVVEEAKEQARAEGERLKAAAQAEVEQEVSRARESLRREVGALALVGAEKVLGRAVDKNSHQDLLDELVKEL